MKSIRRVSLTVCLVAGFAVATIVPSMTADAQAPAQDKLPRRARRRPGGEDVAGNAGAAGARGGRGASERLPLRRVRLPETQSKARSSTSITAAIPATASTARPEHGPSSATGATCRQKPDLSRSFGSAQIERRATPATAMPNFPENTLSDKQAKDIYAYIRTFKSNSPEVKDIPTLNAIVNAASRPYKP